MQYNINLGAWKSVFAVPCEVVDEHLALASAVSLRILLYLLRHSGDDTTNESICKALKLKTEDVEDAILFWEQRGLIAVSDEEISPAARESAKQSTPAKARPEPTQPRAVSKVTPAKAPVLSPGEIVARLKENAEVKSVFERAEECFGRPLNHTEQRSLLSMLDYLGLPGDVVLMILEYAKTSNVTSVRYIETIAVNWADRGINDHAQAEEEIRRLKERNSVEAQVKSLCEISRRLTPKESEFVQRWTQEFKQDLSLIELAYQRTAENTGKASFAYMGKILDSWHNKGITSTEQALAEADGHKKKVAQGKEASYDLDTFDQLALMYTPKPPSESENDK